MIELVGSFFYIDVLDNKIVLFWMRLNGMVQYFILLFRMINNLKYLNCLFFGFFMEYFWILVNKGVVEIMEIRFESNRLLNIYSYYKFVLVLLYCFINNMIILQLRCVNFFQFFVIIFQLFILSIEIFYYRVFWCYDFE